MSNYSELLSVPLVAVAVIVAEPSGAAVMWSDCPTFQSGLIFLF